jgi:predicted ATP-dependent serine protease
MGETVNSQDLLGMTFETIGLQGKFRELIGDPSVGFTAMVFGQPKSGKSTLMLEFAHELASKHGKVLYAAIEEGYGYTLKEKIQRLQVAHPKLVFSEQLPSHLAQYDFVFIDSVSRAGMELEDLIKLKNRYPKTGFIFIFHSTKEGKFRGGNAYAHEVDVIIEVEPGVARASGRFGVGGEVRW